MRQRKITIAVDTFFYLEHRFPFAAHFITSCRLSNSGMFGQMWVVCNQRRLATYHRTWTIHYHFNLPVSAVPASLSLSLSFQGSSQTQAATTSFVMYRRWTQTCEVVALATTGHTEETHTHTAPRVFSPYSGGENFSTFSLSTQNTHPKTRIASSRTNGKIMVK